MFHNLPKLSRLFKDGLVYWLLQMGQPGKTAASYHQIVIAVLQRQFLPMSVAH